MQANVARGRRLAPIGMDVMSQERSATQDQLANASNALGDLREAPTLPTMPSQDENTQMFNRYLKQMAHKSELRPPAEYGSP